MLTAVNRTTKRSQEVLATSDGELLTFPAESSVQALTATGSITGPLYLCGIVISSGSDAAQMTVTSGSDTIFLWRAGAASTCTGFTLPFPVYCANGITCTKDSGTSATFLVYYIPA